MSEPEGIGPTIGDRVLLEADLGEEHLNLGGTVANVTTDEVWVGVDEAHAPLLARLGQAPEVHVVLDRPNVAAAWANTGVRRIFGPGGRVVALSRPSVWEADPRRTHGRARLRLPAYLRAGSEVPVAAAWTTNVSVGGLKCLTDLRLELGQLVEVSLALSPLTTLSCQAQVVRISDSPDDGNSTKLLVAFRFIELSEPDQAQLAAAMAAIGSPGA